MELLSGPSSAECAEPHRGCPGRAAEPMGIPVFPSGHSTSLAGQHSEWYFRCLVTVMGNLHCQLHLTQNHHGNTPLSVSMGVFPERFNLEVTPECECHHSQGTRCQAPAVRAPCFPTVGTTGPGVLLLPGFSIARALPSFSCLSGVLSQLWEC